MKKIACYVRVSTKDQRFASQRSEISKWLRANDIDDSRVEWYQENESGTTLQRPEFERLQRDIFNGDVRQVVLWKLDRLSRRLRDGIEVLSDWCERGIKVTVITQQIELSGAVGRMMAAVMLGLAEIEHEYISERRAAGIEVAKAKGVYKGRKVGTTKGRPERAAQLRAKGLKVDEISEAMGVSTRTVFNYLKTA